MQMFEEPHAARRSLATPVVCDRLQLHEAILVLYTVIRLQVNSIATTAESISHTILHFLQ